MKKNQNNSHGEVEILLTRGPMLTSKGFKTEYEIKNFFNFFWNFFSKSQLTPPLHFLNFLQKKIQLSRVLN